MLYREDRKDRSAELPSLTELLDKKTELREYQRQKRALTHFFGNDDAKDLKDMSREIKKIDEFLISNYFEPLTRPEIFVLGYMNRHNFAKFTHIVNASNDFSDKQIYSAVTSLADKALIWPPRREAFIPQNEKIYRLSPKTANIAKKIISGYNAASW